jgi:hypothetical protein
MRVLIVAALGLASACHGEEQGSTVASSWPVAVDFPRGPEVRFPRVVLVTIDTLRADHVSAYGYRRETMPFFDSLAARGVLFTDANATVSHTAPSHTSMLTGLPTLVRGVHHAATSWTTARRPRARLPRGGYETAACVNERFLERIAHSFDTVTGRARAARGW